APDRPARDYPFFATNHDLAQWGYVEEEFFIEGTANRYTTPPRATASVIDGGHPYKTRILVRRPIDPAKFEGTVFVEWSNVTGANDSDNDWHQVYHHALRSGYAWVVVAAQRNGVHAANTGLKAFSPVRYASLDLTAGGTITNDALRFDVFSQAAQALRNPSGIAPLGNLVPQRLIATGHSQSGGNLNTYYNSILPLGSPFDGFMVRGATGNTAVRDDLGVKVFALQAEADVLSGQNFRKPDSDIYRLWEVAGASHGDYQGQAVSRGPLALRDNGTPLAQVCTNEPSRSRVPFHHAMAAAMDHMVAWLKDGTPPPSGADRWMVLASTAPVVLARDAYGNALGGIRLPDMAVPTALNTGQNTGPGLCSVRGRTVPFDVDTLAALYPRHVDYVHLVDAAAAQSVADGFLLPEDAQATLTKAKWSIVGYGNACDAVCRAAEELRLWTVAFLIRPPHGEELLKSVDKATQAIAGAQYPKARRFVDQYTRELEALQAGGIVMPSIAAVLLRDATALRGAVNALIGAD
ncbi:MAG TPA: alpha/beta hydrolase domain-containing protein, partial [Burkholderiales bacterium]|nr:alpha/beta hydrolase domain-containing protein [Burkholderiales bacterium]